MVQYRFCDICEVLNGRAYKQEELLASGKYPVLRVGNFFSSDHWYYSDMELDERKYCDNGDLLFAWSASFGPRIWDGGKVIYHYHIWKLIPNEIKVDKYYLYYWLKMSVAQLTAGTHGSVMAHMTKSDMESQIIKLPPIETQVKIGQILHRIDEKIKTNEKINDNLQQQAMTLVESALSSGEPTALGQLMSFENGFAFQSNTYQSEGAYRVITIKNVQDGRIDSTGAAYLSEIPSKMKSSCLLKPGDALLSLTGNVGRVGVVCEENLLLNQRVAKINAMNPAWLPFLYFMFRLPSTKITLESIAKGTAQQNLSPVETLKLEIPFDKVLVDTQSGLLAGIYTTILNNSQENLRLAAMRDALLPKLMSGEIDVSDVQI